MWLGSTRRRSVTVMTGIAVVLDRTSDNWLSCLGSRCWMSTNAMPVSVGSSLRSWLNASSPPAEAPMATTGTVVLSGRSEGPSVGGDFGVAVSGKRLDGRLNTDLLRGVFRPISGPHDGQARDDAHDAMGAGPHRPKRKLSSRSKPAALELPQPLSLVMSPFGAAGPSHRARDDQDLGSSRCSIERIPPRHNRAQQSEIGNVLPVARPRPSGLREVLVAISAGPRPKGTARPVAEGGERSETE